MEKNCEKYKAFYKVFLKYSCNAVQEKKYSLKSMTIIIRRNIHIRNTNDETATQDLIMPSSSEIQG